MRGDERGEEREEMDKAVQSVCSRRISVCVVSTRYDYYVYMCLCDSLWSLQVKGLQFLLTQHNDSLPTLRAEVWVREGERALTRPSELDAMGKALERPLCALLDHVDYTPLLGTLAFRCCPPLPFACAARDNRSASFRLGTEQLPTYTP